MIKTPAGRQHTQASTRLVDHHRSRNTARGSDTAIYSTVSVGVFGEGTCRSVTFERRQRPISAVKTQSMISQRYV